MLILAIAALELSVYPMTRYGSSGGTALIWAMVSTYLLWRLWRHGETAWAVLIALVAGTLLLAALVIAGVAGDGGQPAWWLPIRTTADIAELAILLSPPIRRWVSHLDAREARMRLAGSKVRRPTRRPGGSSR